MTLHKSIATLGAVALLVPAAAVAKGKPDDAGSKGKTKSAQKKAKGKGKGKPATFVFKGTWNADGTVAVTSGNSRGKKFKGQTLTFDWSKAKVSGQDTNADGKVDASDVTAGDKVVVQAKLPRDASGTGPFAARKLVDQTEAAAAAPEVTPEPTPEATPPAPEATPTP